MSGRRRVPKPAAKINALVIAREYARKLAPLAWAMLAGTPE